MNRGVEIEVIKINVVTQKKASLEGGRKGRKELFPRRHLCRFARGGDFERASGTRVDPLQGRHGEGLDGVPVLLQEKTRMLRNSQKRKETKKQVEKRQR